MPKFNKIDLANYEKPTKFLKFKQGDNRIRVLTEPYLYQVVGKKAGNRFVRHILEEGLAIPDFLSDVTPKTVWGFVVYSHDTGHYHILETGPQLGDPLTKLLKAKYPEEFKAVDIIINRKGERLKTEYTCAYAPKTEPLPKDASKENPEYQYITAYFKG